MTKTPNKTNPPPEPTGDPLIDEVRALKRAVAEEFGNDVERLGRHLMEMREKLGVHVVRGVPPGPNSIRE